MGNVESESTAAAPPRGERVFCIAVLSAYAVLLAIPELIRRIRARYPGEAPLIVLNLRARHPALRLVHDASDPDTIVEDENFYVYRLAGAGGSPAN